MPRFGISIPNGWLLDLANVDGSAQKWATTRANVIEAERNGFDSAWIVDHFHTFPLKTVEATFEAFTTLTALAEATKSIRLGQMVTCNSYRNPAYLAKISACLDVISGGRVTLGIGAGWYSEEYDAYGYEFPNIGTRLRMLKEACEILKRLWTEERVTYAGKHYQLKDAICEPKPLQRPHPPLLIGGSGEKVLLRHVARYANAWNANLPFDEYRRKVDILRRHCKEVGRNPDEIELTISLPMVIVDDHKDINAVLSERVPKSLPVEMVRQRYEQAGGVFGTPAEVAEKLQPWIKFGLGTIICVFADPVSRKQMKRFATEIRPTL
ncbi:MAG TPA: LLM class F420-dependent oxidoreductase [Candidatus Kryptonia bacterium]|nr:LLM class F420-dependent oxidoreductase [Candidatus Kryptonia bacterium]